MGLAVLACPRLGGEVELTEEREEHIAERHPELLPEHRRLLGETLLRPDLVRRSARSPNARMVSRWFDELRGGKHVVVVVVTDPPPAHRHWVVAAYITGKTVGGETEWRRS